MNSSKLLSLLLYVLILAIAGSAAAQETHSPDSSKVERKNRAPVSKNVLKVTLPRATEATLSNGLTVVILENRRLPLVSIEYNIIRSMVRLDERRALEPDVPRRRTKPAQAAAQGPAAPTTGESELPVQ